MADLGQLAREREERKRRDEEAKRNEGRRGGADGPGDGAPNDQDEERQGLLGCCMCPTNG